MHLNGRLCHSASLSALGALDRRLPVLLLLLLLVLVHLLLHHLNWHWLYWLSAIQTCHLLFQIGVFHFQKLNLPLETEDYLLFGVHLQNWLVLDVHGPRCIIQGRNSLIDISFRGGNTSNHESFRGSTQTVLKKHRQL